MCNESILNPIVYKNDLMSIKCLFRPIPPQKQTGFSLRTALRRTNMHKRGKGLSRVGEVVSTFHETAQPPPPCYAFYQVDDDLNAIGVKTAVIPKHPTKRSHTFFSMNKRIRRKIVALTDNKKAGAISTRLIADN